MVTLLDWSHGEGGRAQQFVRLDSSGLPKVIIVVVRFQTL